MRRRIVLVSILVILVGTTIGVTSVGKVDIFKMFSYTDILVASGDHMLMVGWALLFSVIIGVFFGVLITRPMVSKFSLPVMGIVSMGQAMPSLALIAIIAILPLSFWGLINFGFNLPTTIVALVVYGLMPIVRN